MKIDSRTDLSRMSKHVREQIEAAQAEPQQVPARIRQQISRMSGAQEYAPRPVADPDRPLRTETIFIPYLGKSLNDYLFPAGGAFAYRRDKHTCAWACTQAGVGKLPKFDRPVRLTYLPKVPETRRRYDATNFGAVIKQIEDCLVSLGVIRQDDQRWVRGFSVEPAELASDGIAGMQVTLQEVK